MRLATTLAAVAVLAAAAGPSSAVRVRMEDETVPSYMPSLEGPEATPAAPAQHDAGWNPMAERSNADHFYLDDDDAASGSMRFREEPMDISEKVEKEDDKAQEESDSTKERGDRKDESSSEYQAAEDPSQPSGSEYQKDVVGEKEVDYQGEKGEGEYQSGEYQGSSGEYQSGEYQKDVPKDDKDTKDVGAKGSDNPNAPAGVPLEGDPKGSDDAEAADEKNQEQEKAVEQEKSDAASQTQTQTQSQSGGGGSQGAQGERGPPGPPGAQGPAGAQGPPGKGAEVSAAEVQKLEARVGELEYMNEALKEVVKAVFPSWATASTACPDGWTNLGYKELESRVWCEPPSDGANLGNPACKSVAKFPRSYDRCGWSTVCRVRWQQYGCYAETGAAVQQQADSSNTKSKEEAADAKAAEGQESSESELEEARRLRQEILGTSGSSEETKTAAAAVKPEEKKEEEAAPERAAPSLIESFDDIRPAAFNAPAIPAAPAAPKPFDHGRLASFGQQE